MLGIGIEVIIINHSNLDLNGVRGIIIKTLYKGYSDPKFNQWMHLVDLEFIIDGIKHWYIEEENLISFRKFKLNEYLKCI